MIGPQAGEVREDIVSACRKTKHCGRDITFLKSDAHFRIVVEMGTGSVACAARTRGVVESVGFGGQKRNIRETTTYHQ